MFFRRKKYVCTSICWTLNSPAAMRRWIHWCDGLKRRVCPTIAIRSDAAAAASVASASARESASGISTWTCLPASSTACVCSACCLVGVARITASTSSRSSTASSPSTAFRTPYCSATFCADSAERLLTTVTLASAMFASPSRCFMPKAPAAPTTATLTFSLLMGVLLSVGRVGQDEVADGGVRRGHVVEAVPDLGGAPAELVVHRPAGDEPVDQLDSFGAGLVDIIQVRPRGQAHRIRYEQVEVGIVPLRVDQARAGTLQLVAHATRPPDLHVQRFTVPLVEGAADGLAELVAAASGRDGVLHHVHGQRDHPARPRLDVAEQQRQGHGQAVVDDHLVDEREVEVVHDHRLRDVGRQLGEALHVGDRAGAVA